MELQRESRPTVERVPPQSVELEMCVLGGIMLEPEEAKDEAFAFLEKAFETRDHRLVWLKTEQAVDSLRSDPRFSDLLRRLNLPE